MGEIKSTLDIVLEKTKHMTLSEDEKREQKYKEFEKSMKGLLQKYQDKLLNLQKLKTELNDLKKSYDLTTEKILIPEVLDRIDLDQDNEPLLSLLEEMYDVDVTRLRKVLRDYENTILASTHKKVDTLKENLARKYSITGSAASPNLEADDAWVAELQKIRSEFSRDLSQEKGSLADSY